jgi:hypothetical protein
MAVAEHTDPVAERAAQPAKILTPRECVFASA